MKIGIIGSGNIGGNLVLSSDRSVEITSSDARLSSSGRCGATPCFS
ncbi:MAG: hypothetical protein AAFW70_11040 [Cyanobacteria bacterium J06635_10]